MYMQHTHRYLHANVVDSHHTGHDFCGSVSVSVSVSVSLSLSLSVSFCLSVCRYAFALIDILVGLGFMVLATILQEESDFPLCPLRTTHMCTFKFCMQSAF